jgi:hypothetical protein
MGQKFLDALDDVTVDREQKSWAGGADEFATPTELPVNMGGRLVNCIVEDNGRPRNRPGADPLGGAVLDAGDRVQALTYFDTPTLEYLYASINASLRQWDSAAWTTVGAYPFGVNTIVDMVQGNNVLYCTDGTSQWRSYSGAAWSGALGSTTADPPVGATILAWHTFRMFAAGAIGGIYDQIYASDLGQAGTGDWDHVTFAFRVGRGEGERIVGLLSGRGNYLFVGKEGSIYVVYTNPQAVSAAEWPINRLAGSVGLVGQRAWCMSGDSLFVVGPDLALREIVPSAVEDTPFETAPPASEPAKPYMDRINRAAQGRILLTKYGRYLLMAVPLDGATDPSHVLVWSLRLRRPSEVAGYTLPAFIGVWTGWTPTVFGTTRFAGVERLVFGDAAGYVQQWKDFEDQTEDDTYMDDTAPVLATMRGRSWDFGTQRNPKDAESQELQFQDSTAEVDILAVFDGEEQARWTKNLEETQNELPVDLPFDLAVLGPTRDTRNMDELPEFREMYIEVQQVTAGRVELKSMSASAFINTQANE